MAGRVAPGPSGNDVSRSSLTGLNLFPGRIGPGVMWLVRWGILLCLALFFGLPMLWLLLAPSQTNAQLNTSIGIGFGSFANYATAFHNLLNYQSGVYGVWALNSAIYVFAAMAIAMVLDLCAGYALAVYNFPGRRVILSLTLFALIMPPAALVLPLFLEMSAVHLLNTAWAVILPSGFFPFGVYLSYIYFSTSMPTDILAAAEVDGASQFRIFRSIALPLARPLVGLVAFFAFVAQWNNFFLVSVMIGQTNRQNLQVGITTLIGDAFVPGPQAPPGIAKPEVALAGMLLAAPLVILFLAIQRHLVRGLLSGYGVG